MVKSEIKISFEKMRQVALIKNLKLNKYIYLKSKIEEYKDNVEKNNFSKIEENFKKVYISFYDMQKEKVKWKKNFFIYFERLIKEQNEFQEFDDNAEKKLKEIIYVLSNLENLDEKYLKDINNDLKKIIKSTLKENIKLYKSFATKLFSILNPNMPVWDSNVIQSLKNVLSDNSNNSIKIIENTNKEFDTRVKNTISVYKEIYMIEKNMLCNREVEVEIQKFKVFYDKLKNELLNFKIKDVDEQEYINCINNIDSGDISDMKILDFFLWKKATIKNKCGVDTV